ncbi:MAG: 4'-phosphopantetheinyl transferase superfamily protein [Clostridiales bacterium]|nr:4'-phosphopantetheinyl transferase superfamily protein [Clostridiales bacterium]
MSILADSPIDAIAADENGRPFFHDSDMDFSISHSGGASAGAVAVSLVSEGNLDPAGSRLKIQSENTHEAKIRTGCDIQLIRPRKNQRNIAEENFCAAERDYIFSQDAAQFESARFFQIWTLKECYIKLRGLSVFDMHKAPSFISRDAAGRYLFTFNATRSSSLSFYLYELAYAGERYMLATAIEGDWDIRPEIRLFS